MEKMSRVGDDQLQPFDESVIIVHGYFYCKIDEQKCMQSIYAYQDFRKP